MTPINRLLSAYIRIHGLYGCFTWFEPIPAHPIYIIYNIYAVIFEFLLWVETDLLGRKMRKSANKFAHIKKIHYLCTR